MWTGHRCANRSGSLCYHPHAHKLGGDLARVNVIQVDTYGDCYLVALAGGGLFRWGNSEYLQLASVTDSRQVNVPPVLALLRSGMGEADCVWGDRLCCIKQRRTRFCLGLWNSWEGTKPLGNRSSRNDSTHSVWPDGVQPGRPGFPHSLRTQPLCRPDQ